ncbi:MAG: IS200/IS605 family element RNA-guided endonuclease TnpB [Lysinibacillus sp.]
MVLKAFKFRCYPTKEQASLIHKTFGCCRFVFNQLLGEQQERDRQWAISKKADEDHQTSQNACISKIFKKFDNIKKIPLLKKEYPFLKEVDSIALQSSVEHLADGFDRFYKKQNEKPKFKSKKNPIQSYTTKSVNGNISINDHYIKIPKLGFLRFAKSREVTGTIKRVILRQNAVGKYFISVLAETEAAPLPKTEQAVGIDLGLSSFATFSSGETIQNHRFFSTLEKQLHKAQRILSRRIQLALDKGIPLREAKNVQKQRIQVAKIHEKIRNKRNDFLHKLSTQLVKNHDIICAENLSTKTLIEGKHYSKSISDVSWSSFLTMLEYKAAWYGKTFVKVDQAFPSTQLCSTCGEKNPETKDLSVRSWVCSSCHSLHDRDRNAAHNILIEGLRLLTAGTAGIA